MRRGRGRHFWEANEEIAHIASRETYHMPGSISRASQVLRLCIYYHILFL